MRRLGRWTTTHRWWVVLAWVVLTVAGVVGAPKAVDALSYDFSLPGQPGAETNTEIARLFGNGGDNAPVILVVGNGTAQVPRSAGTALTQAVAKALPGSRVAGYDTLGSLRGKDERSGYVLVFPPTVGGPDPYAKALPVLDAVAAQAAQQTGQPVAVTGTDALAADSGGSGGADVLVETIAGGLGALIVLALVFGSFLALMPLVVAAGSILTTFLIVWGLTSFTEVSFIVQYLLALIGLGVAIDYALLVVTRWREERGLLAAAEGTSARALGREDNDRAIRRALETAGRSVVFSGTTVAVSLAALIALPVPFLRSIGFTGLLIPLVSVIAALSLLPALLSIVGPRLDWPHRRTTDPTSRLWHRVGETVVRHRWWSAALATLLLLLLAVPVLGIRLGQPSNESLAQSGGAAGRALTTLVGSGVGEGLTQPVEILTTPDDANRVREAVAGVPGLAAVVAPDDWAKDGRAMVTAWTTGDPAGAGRSVAERVREVATAQGARVGGIPAQDADFVQAVYGNAWWVVLLIVVVTFVLLARALRSVVLPLKALVLNVLSLGAAYGITVLIWQEGHGTELLFSQSASGSITTWVPIAVFAFLFGLSMDYEVFLLSRIREEYDRTKDTDEATVVGVSRTGRLVTSAAIILFLAFVSLSRVPSTDVKILATALALGIVIDATVVRGVLAPALVAALGPANWWYPLRPRHHGRHLADDQVQD